MRGFKLHPRDLEGFFLSVVKLACSLLSIVYCLLFVVLLFSCSQTSSWRTASIIFLFVVKIGGIISLRLEWEGSNSTQETWRDFFYLLWNWLAVYCLLFVVDCLLFSCSQSSSWRTASIIFLFVVKIGGIISLRLEWEGSNSTQETWRDSRKLRWTLRHSAFKTIES